MIRFLVPGAPVPWKSPTIVRRANSRFPVAVKAAATAGYQAVVALSAMQAMAGRDPFSRETPLFLRLEITMPVPQSWSARKRLRALNGEVRPTSRPDASNIIKCVEDGCLGVLFADDSSVVELVASKRYGATPGLTVECVPLNTAMEAKAAQPELGADELLAPSQKRKAA